MRKIKVLFFMVCICILTSVIPALGAGEVLYSYTDDFSSYTANMYNEFGASMQGNWRTATAAECDRSSVNMGYAGGKLKICTNTSTVNTKYTTGNAKVFPCAVLTADRSGLLAGQKISVKAKKTHQSDMWGVRFYVHEGTGNTLNYYTLLFGGMYTYTQSSGYLTWGLYKSVNGTVSCLAEKARESGLGSRDDIDGYMGTGDAELEISFADGKIDWSLTYTKDGTSYGYNETYTDVSPFEITGNGTTVHLYAAGSDDPSRYVYFDDFKLESKESAQPDLNFSFADNFSSYAENMYTGFGLAMQRNWRTVTASECDRSSVNIGYAGGKLKVCTNTSTVNTKYTTGNALSFPGAVLTANRSGLLAGQKISVKAKKTHQSDMWGVRFYVHGGAGGTLNYYTLLFGGMYTYAQDSGNLTWGLYKSINGTVTKLAEKTREGTGGRDTVDGYMGTGDAELELTVIDGKIDWNLTYTKDGVSYGYNESYTDAYPFEVEGADTTVHLYAAGSDEPSRFVYFDDFTIESCVPFLTGGEPSEVMYYNASYGKEKNSDGIIDLSKDTVIRKLLYSGEAVSGSILVSKDCEEWETLTDLSNFENGKFVNTVTDEAYRYISVGALQGDFKVLTDVSEIEGKYTDEGLKLYPRVGGTDYFSDSDNILTTDDADLIDIDGTYISPLGVGAANVTASVNGRRISVSVTYNSGIYSYFDSFDGVGTSTYSGQNVQFDKAWRSKTSDEGYMGYNNDASVGYNNNRIFVQARGVKDDDSFSRYPRWAETVPAAVFNADHKELAVNQIIKMKISKTSGTESSGVRFMVHDNGNSYYLLLFPGMYGLGGLSDRDSNYSSWELIKCEGGQYTMLGRAERGANNADTETGFLSRGTGDLTIKYIDGKISWDMPVYKDGAQIFRWSGEYEDDEPFELEGNASTVWLISGLYSGDNLSRGTYFDDIKIASYVPYVTVDEPGTVIYADIVEGKNATGGVYELDGEYSIRRIVSDSVSGTLNVYASKDNAKWYKICGFDSDGEYLNNIYEDKFSYIKKVGTGNISVLSEITESGIKVKPEETRTLYPYIGGELYENPVVTEETGCVQISGRRITGKSAVKNDVALVICGAAEAAVKITVPLLDITYEITESGNDALIEITAEELEGLNTGIVVAFYDADHSMRSMETFSGSFSGGTETVRVNNFYTKGAYSRLFVWSGNINNAVPYTKAVTLSTVKRNG